MISATHRHLHAHTHPHHHAHAHTRQAYAYSHSALTSRHEDELLDEKLAEPAGSEMCSESVLDVARERLGGEHFTSISTNSAIEHRTKMNRHFTSMYTQELLEESRLDAGLVWAKPANGEVSVDAILSANSALPKDLQTH